jgi:AcrR family transcriptional regulator
MELTRERILEVAEAAFTSRWYDEVTMRGLAAEASVALQTVLNHFPTKEGLFAVALERWGDRIQSARWTAEPDDIAGAVAVLIDDYERTGEAALRFLSLEGRVEVVSEPLTRGRAGHERWVERTFPSALQGKRGEARRRRLAQLVAVTDVFTWKLFRHDRSFTVQQTEKTMAELVSALYDRKAET